MTADARWIGAAARAVVVRPGLWLTAVGVIVRLARPGWWRRWPPIPAPPDGYWRFRLETANGGDVPPTPEDVVAYLRWCQRTGPPRG